MTRCHVCEYDYDQCDDCVRKDKEDYERTHYWCKESEEYGNPKPSKECKLKATGIKEDSCSHCGYVYIYP